jgi:type VI secretion system protein VasG
MALRLPLGQRLNELFSNFSPASGRVLRAAEQECRNHNHYYVGVEHLLVALLEEHDPDISARLRAEAMDAGEIHAEARRALGTGEDRLWEGILVTPRLRKIVALASQRAGDRLIEPIDLFQAIQDEGGSLGAEILRRARTHPTAVTPTTANE